MTSMKTGPSAIPAEVTEIWRELGLQRDLSLGEAMALAAREHPAAPFHLYAAEGSRNTTLREIHTAGRQLAGSLSALGLERGDVVAMQLPNSVENAVLFHAAALLGCTLLPIVHIFGPGELIHILGDSGAKVLVVPDRWRSIDYLERLDRLPDLPKLTHRIIVGSAVPAGCLAWDALPPGACPSIAADPDATALLLYTSGTTAAPKGVRHSSRTLLAELAAQELGWSNSGAVLAPWPSGHIAGSLAMLGHAVLGRSTVVLESWDAAAAAELVETFGIDQSSGTPFHLSGLMEAAARDQRDLSSLKRFIIGATTVPPALVAASEAAGIRCCRCYGSTEMPTFSQCDPDDPIEKRLNTDGRLNPGCEVRIVDDAGRDLAPGREGEIALRGPERFIGYTDPALEAASFLPGGWFITGDIGKVDEDGYLAITDRKKDIIIRGGENISSREIEELLLQVPGVRDAAAIGWPDERLGERVCAVLILEPGADVSIDLIARVFAKIGVARQKVPERLEVVEQLPRTPTGKVQKAALRKLLLSA